MNKLYEETQELFTEANNKLSHEKLGYWLSFVYGVMSSRMTKKDLKMCRTHLKNLGVKNANTAK